jgi:hypothetical protein
VFFALIALCLAQSVAQLHALSHLTARDTPALPGQHSPVCSDCVSHAPLLTMGTATAVPFFLAVRTFQVLALHAIRAPAGRNLHTAFRARAPPR